MGKPRVNIGYPERRREEMIFLINFQKGIKTDSFRLDWEMVLQRFNRSDVPVPGAFSSPEADQYRQRLLKFYLDDEEARAQKRVPEVGEWIRAHDIKRTLIQLFRNKCAFCEQRTTLEIERFRPQTEAVFTKDGRDSHLYYSWLAGAWENFYPACRDCNAHRHTKRRNFPVTGAPLTLPTHDMVANYVERGDGLWGGYPLEEGNLLLDPCYDSKLHLHLGASVSGVIYPRSKRGEATIDIFRLNDLALTNSRAIRMAEYLHAALAGVHDFDFPSLEFGGFWYLVLREHVSTLSERKFFEEALEPETIRGVIRELGSTSLEPLSKLAVVPERIPELEGFSFESLPSPPRHISTIEIRNYKAVENLTLTLPQPDAHNAQPALLILGENSAGKSSILEAIALALCQPAERKALKLNRRSLMLAEEYMGGIKGRHRPSTVTISFARHKPRVFRADERGMSGGADDMELPVFAYGAFRQYLDGRETRSLAKAVVTLFRSDKILTNPEQWLMAREDGDFYKVSRALREIFAFEKDFDFIQRDKENQRCFLIHSKDKNSGKTPLSLASSGFRSLLGMICEVMQGLLDAGVSSGEETFDSVRAVVLIDEVEAHLHPRWKMQVMTGLRRALPAVTFIATTHDPLCLRGMKAGEVVVVRRGRRENVDDMSLAECVELLSDLPDLTQLSIEQLLTSDFFGLFSTDNPDIEKALGSLSDVAPLEDENTVQQRALEKLENEIANLLPIGHTATEQLIQSVLLDYLKKRRQASAEELSRLNDHAKESILDALEGI